MDIRSVRDFFFRLVRPSFWHQNYPTCHDYSDSLEAQIDAEAEVEVVDRYTVLINGVELWASNYPYSYGYQYQNRLSRVLPSARVRAKLKRYIASKYKTNPWGQ